MRQPMTTDAIFPVTQTPKKDGKWTTTFGDRLNETGVPTFRNVWKERGRPQVAVMLSDELGDRVIAWENERATENDERVQIDARTWYDAAELVASQMLDDEDGDFDDAGEPRPAVMDYAREWAEHWLKAECCRLIYLARKAIEAADAA